MTYALSRTLLLSFFLVYVTIGFGGHLLRTGTEDFYPFFSWSLFARVPPAVQTSFDAQLVSVGGTAIDPTPLENRPDVFDETGGSIDVKSEIQQVGRALVGKNQQEADAHVQRLVPLFRIPASFEIRSVTYDLLERFKTGIIQKSKILQRFDILSR